MLSTVITDRLIGSFTKTARKEGWSPAKIEAYAQSIRDDRTPNDIWASYARLKQQFPA